MLYDVTLTISYEYQAPSSHARNRFRLLPGDIPMNQSVPSRLLTFDPMPTERYDGLDFFLNATTSAIWHHPIKAFEVKLTTRIDRQVWTGEFDISPNLQGLAAELSAHRDIGPGSPHHFTAPSARATPWPDLAAAVREWYDPSMSVFQIVTAIGEALHREMTFDSDATHVNTPAAEAFANRRGVCQDFTHVMIAALRGIGIPAGYVSGFLRTYPPPGQPRLEGADAMHAWVRAWTGGEMGWVEYDPTNGRTSGADHLTVGYGRDYDDVAPVRGALRGLGEQKSKQAVDVLPVSD